MTLDEFFKNLISVRDEFDWHIEPNPEWYTESRASRRGWIRARPKKGVAAGALLDPIGAVCYAMTGQPYSEKSWAAAAEALGLGPAHASNLSAAADDRVWDGDLGGRKPVERLHSLRERLLDALELRVRH